MSPSSVIALACGVLVAYFNGANDVSKGIATLAGSGVTNYRRAILWGTACTGIGALASSVLSGAMIATFGAGLLAHGTTLMFREALAVLLGVATCVGLATRLGLPVSTTHAIVGSMAGVYSFSLGVGGVNWQALGGKVALPLLLSPFLALTLVVLGLRAERLIARRLGKASECLCVDLRLPALPATSVAVGSSLAISQAATRVDIRLGSEAACAADGPSAFRVTSRQLHWLTSGATSFARGLNDTPKIVALVLPIVALSRGSPSDALAFLAVTLGMVAGSWMAGKKVTRVLAEKVTTMDHREGFIANLVTAALVGPGATLGLPMSTTHVSSGAIIGVGTSKKAELNWRTVQNMLVAWVLTLPLAAVLGVLALTGIMSIQGAEGATAPKPDSVEFHEGETFPTAVFPGVDSGRPGSVADFRGKKLILHIFASW